MQSKKSISGTTIFYDPETKHHNISDILRERFDEATLSKNTIDDLYDPYLMKDMDKAVERIKLAKTQKQKVVVFGDYDVDGVTSTSLVVHMLSTLGMQVSYRLPHRVHDGYGLKDKFVDELEKLGVNLIITVDCGSRDAKIVSRAKKLGVDIIVTDHHHVPEDMPEDAIAFLNPNRPDCIYPDKNLAGAGVAFKLVMALAKLYFPEEQYRKYITESIDIAAIGTVADCMQIVGENRVIVLEGLRQLKKSRSRGVRQLIEDKIHEDLDADVFGFQIGPRLNAAGRMDTPYKALNLILNNEESVFDTLREIEDLNNLRKSKTLEHVEAALENINAQDNMIIYHSENIEHGIIGIVAGRLTERYFKPSIVLTGEGDTLVASCRSPDYFSMIDLLDQYKDMFVAYGGHKNAAGFSVLKKDFPEFKERLLKDINARDFSSYTKEIQIDKCLSLDEIGFKLLESINEFKPYGMGNPKPLLLVGNFSPTKVSFLGKGREHLKLDNKYGFKIFAFGMGEYYDVLKKQESFDIIFDISEDYWQGKRGIMIKVVDIVI